MKTRALYATAGGFSLVNTKLHEALLIEMADVEWIDFPILKQSLHKKPFHEAALILESLMRFPKVILGSRIPPRDLVVRLPGFQRLLSERVRNAAKEVSFTFQTQSLFDASAPHVPHFLYTDHTHRANQRYSPPRKSWPLPKAWHEMERKLYLNARVCFTTSIFAAQSLIEDYGVSPDRVEVVESGCNIGLPTEAPQRNREPRRVLFLGVEWERKGGPILLEAMSIVQKQCPDATLDVVGCENPGYALSGVTFHGRVARDKVGEFLRKADMLCLPSLAEPSAVALVEASGFSLPVITTRVGGSPERVLDQKTGLLVDPGDVQGLATALLELMMDPEKAARFGIAGRSMVMEKFTWSAVARAIARRIRKEIVQ